MIALSKWLIGGILGLVFLWCTFWVYMLTVEAGTVLMVFIIPFVISLMPLVLLYRTIKGEKVTVGDWVFFLILSAIFGLVSYAIILSY